MKEKILLVDDSSDTIFMIEKKLDEYDVVSVKNGKEMWERIDEVKPKLLLLDVIIPDDDGFEIARKLTAIDKYSHIPIVFITAKTEGKDVATGFDSGGFDYIKKPFDPVEMRARIKSAIMKKQQVADLKKLSYTDYLTGAYNRAFFIDALVKELEKRKRKEDLHFSVAMLDIDFFKMINDNYGHQAGDQVLMEFVSYLRGTIRPYDLLARYGGEEFIVLLHDCPKKSAQVILERFKATLEREMIHYRDNPIKVTFSAGIADMTDFLRHEPTVESVVRLADQRLYEAKQNGRNQIHAE